MAETLQMMSYLYNAFDDTERLVKNAESRLYGVDFDTMIGTGLSGALVIPVLARAMGKKFAIVRKLDKEASHSRNIFEGEIGQKWIFVDDFVASGRTRLHVREIIDDYVKRHNSWSSDKFHTQYVGTYTYEDDGERYQPTFTAA